MKKRFLIGLTFAFVAGMEAYQDNNAALQTHIEQDRQLFRELDIPAVKKGTPPTWDKLDDDQTIPAIADRHQPTKEALAWAKKGERESAKGHHEKARHDLEQALAADPKFFEAENNLALELLALHQPDAAILHLRHLTDLYPERVFVFNNLGSVLCRLNRFPEAEAVARESLRRHPHSFTSNLILGLSLLAQGKRTPEAKQALVFASVQRPEAKTLLAQWTAH